MSDADRLKYRAFLSYSHADTGLARRVHRRLESFHIDKELVGRTTRTGVIPETLGPIFRDRHDFDVGSSLGALTTAAIDNSTALIFIASPNSARSEAANEEVRLFKFRHPNRPVIPLIVDGEPGVREEECFPPALRFVVARDGVITRTPADILAADLREKGDGFELALAKVVAGLIGLAPDDVYRRAERERRKQQRARIMVVAVIVLLAVIGGGLFWRSYQQNQTLTDISALVDKYSPTSSAEAAVPGRERSLTEAITAIVEGAATDTRYAQALTFLKSGNPKQAELLLKVVAEDKEKRSDMDAKAAAAAYRNLASIAAVTDPGRARDYYARAAALDPSNVVGMLRNGQSQEDAGKLDAAQASYARIITIAKPGDDDEIVLWAKFGMGDILTDRGNLGAALATYRDAKTIAGQLAQSAPENTEWQRDMSVSLIKMGDVEIEQRDLASALASYRASLSIRDRLAKSAPGNTRFQDDLSVTLNKLGAVQVAQGDLAGALASYRDSLAVMKLLVKSAPDNARWQRDLSVTLNKVGDVQVAQGSLADALSSYQDGLAIIKRLTKTDSDNQSREFDLGISNERIGDVLLKQGDLSGSLKSYQVKQDIDRRLVKSDPENASWMRDLAVSLKKIGDVQVAQADFAGARDSYEASFTISQTLVTRDETNERWRNDIGGLAYRFVLARDFNDALKAAGRAISLTPDEIWVYSNRAHALMFLGRIDEARAVYLRYQGRKNVEPGKTWDVVILGDFAALRKVGLSNPLMDEIERLFRKSGSNSLR